ncbi:MAG: hypothetical protein F6K31_10415 [Symploca sp. SIO2G7]|nr:hypothetical protein [Symploca sp. SIO2G7]
MKFTSVIKFLTGATVAIGATTLISEPSQACPTEEHKSCDVQVEVICSAEHVAPCPPENHSTYQPTSVHYPQKRNIFVCEKSHGVPTTFVRTPEGKYPIIKWVSSYFSGAGYTPEVRCKDVSKRFQTFYDNGVLNYITTGIFNNQPVVCVANTYGGPCQGVLFTLKRGQDASRVVQQLFDLRANPNEEPLRESGSRVYFDLNQYIENL